MIAPAPQDAQDARIATLEREVEDALRALDGRIAGLDERVRRVEHEDRPPLDPVLPRLQTSGMQDGLAGRRATRARASSKRTGTALADLVGGRVLAWLGGLATLLGIVLLLILAVSKGWIGTEARVLVAAAGSAALLAAGAWLHERRGRTEAATAMVGAATAGLFATLIVASDVYGLLPDAAAVAGALLVGGLATYLAIRWAGRAVGGLGLIGALLCCALAGVPGDGVTILVLTIAAFCSMWIVVRQRWGWLGLATVAVCAPQWGAWVLQGQPPLLELLVLVSFAALGLAGAVGAQLRGGEHPLAPASAAVLTLSASTAAVIGHVALADAASSSVANIWLAALALVYLTVGARLGRKEGASLPLRQLLIAVGVTLADVAFGLSANGIALAVGWSASAVALAWVLRRSPRETRTDVLFTLGVGTQIALALIRALIDLPPSALGASHTSLAPLLSVAALAAGCLAAGQLAGGERASWANVLNALGLTAIAYLTAATLDGAVLTAAWAFEGLALAQLNLRTRDAVSRIGGLAFVAAAVVHALIRDAPPGSLTAGAADLGPAAVALGALAVVGLRVGLALPAGAVRRPWALVGAGTAILYLASIATVTVLTPASAAGAVLELGARQQGQVALSALWGLVGLAALTLGLRRDFAAVRTAGLSLMLLAVGKVFLYDLSTLTSVYRVVSFIVLGLLLLVGAYAYQRMRPPPLPDLRSRPPGTR